MKRKWNIVVIALCVAALLTGIYAAAAGGSSSDPLISLSYLKNIFTGEVEQMVDEAITGVDEKVIADVDSAIEDWTTQVTQQVQGALNSVQVPSPASFVTCVALVGETVTVEAGSEIAVVGGIPVCSADLIDQTDGSVWEAGRVMKANHLYIALESCTITALEEAPDPIRTGVVEIDSLNVRSGPGTSYTVKGKLAKNTVITILEDLDGWYKFESDKISGYVSATYIILNKVVVDYTGDPGVDTRLLIRGGYTSGNGGSDIKPDSTYTVTVVDENHAPVSGVAVSIGGTGGTTNAAGKFSALLPAGTYDVSVTAPEGYTVPAGDYQVTAEATALTVKLTKVEKKADYTVAVVDENDAPMSGVTVSIGGTGGTTGSDGKLTVQLPAGTYDVSVTAPDGYIVSAGNYQVTVDSPALTVKLSKVVEKADYTVIVVDENNAPLSGVTVAIGSVTGTTDSSGRFTASLAKGSYTAKVIFPEGYTADSDSAAFPDGETELTMVLTAKEEEKTLSGTVIAGPLNVRSGPGLGYSRNGMLNKGDTVTILETNGSWYRIESGNLTGYVSAMYIKVNEEQQVITGTTTYALNVRSGPGITYNKIGLLSKGATVTILETRNGWYKVTNGTITGYVSADYIVLNTSSGT